jgi:hypothetical protein
MAGPEAGSPEYLAETNHPELDQQVSIAFVVIDTFFLLVFYASRYYNPKAVTLPMLVCNTLCYMLCLGSAATGICESFPSRQLAKTPGSQNDVLAQMSMGYRAVPTSSQRLDRTRAYRELNYFKRERCILIRSSDGEDRRRRIPCYRRPSDYFPDMAATIQSPGVHIYTRGHVRQACRSNPLPPSLRSHTIPSRYHWYRSNHNTPRCHSFHPRFLDLPAFQILLDSSS